MKNLVAWALLIELLGVGVFSGCGNINASSDGSPYAGAGDLRAQRTGAPGACSFSARGAITDQYPCAALVVMASASTATNLTSIAITPSAGKTQVSGTLQLSGVVPKVGSYELKDFSLFGFSITDPSGSHPGWLCQSGAGRPELGALKMEITAVHAFPGFGTTTNFLINGVFEALLISVDPQSSGTVILHGEF